MSQKIKQIIIAIVIIVIAFVGFQKFFGTSNAGDASLTADNGTAKTFVDGQTILNLLTRLNKVDLDDKIFSSVVFNSLTSFEVPIPDQVIERPNPFAPIGSDLSN
jgi:hypothetical protein